MPCTFGGCGTTRGERKRGPRRGKAKNEEDGGNETEDTDEGEEDNEVDPVEEPRSISVKMWTLRWPQKSSGFMGRTECPNPGTFILMPWLPNLNFG